MNSLSKEVYKVCIDSVKINNRFISRQTINAMSMQAVVKQSEKKNDYKYNNILSSLSFESKTDIQLLVVEVLNTGSATQQMPSTINHAVTLSNSYRFQEGGTQLLSNYKAYPVLYHLKIESSKEPSPYIAMDKRTGRHFVYNNDDRIMVFSHKPIFNTESDKSKPLLCMSLDDKYDGKQNLEQNSQSWEDGQDISTELEDQSKAKMKWKVRVNPTMTIISDEKGNTALLVIGGFVELQNGSVQPKRNIKVFNIGKREIDVKPAFSIALKHPRVNPIVVKVKQKDCKDVKASQSDDTKYLILVGGASPSTVEDKVLFANTNTQCSVIQYEAIFNQLLRKDATELQESKTLKVIYNDKDKGRNFEKLAEKLAKGVFVHQKNKNNTNIHDKMFLLCDKRKQVFLVNAISMTENFISIFDTDIELRTENSWSYTNTCSIENCLLYISPQQISPVAVETNGKNSKTMNSRDLVEYNGKRSKDIFSEILPSKKVTNCRCAIY